METPSLRLPTVNVGHRQDGRERAANILDAAPNEQAILGAARRALDPAFRRSLEGLVNPYGDGHASKRIVGILAEVPLGEKLLRKKPVAISAER